MVWYMLVLYVNFSDKCLKFVPKWSNPFFQPILVAIFVTIAAVEVKLIAAVVIDCIDS